MHQFFELGKKRRRVQTPDDLTVRLLEAGTSAPATELLGLAAAGIGNEECTVIADKDVFDLLLGLLINVLLIESYDSLGDALADGVYLGGLATTAHADAEVDTHEALPPEKEDGLEGLEAEDLRLHQLDRHPIHLDQPAPALAVRHRYRRLLPPEALHRFHRRRSHRHR
ncbi:unnamed protein product [Musa acuminata subsp. burmannicoides]